MRACMVARLALVAPAMCFQWLRKVLAPRAGLQMASENRALRCQTHL